MERNFENDENLLSPVLLTITRNAAAAENSRDLHEINTEKRNRAIVEAVDMGFDQNDVAEAAHLSNSRIAAILGQSEKWRNSGD